MGKVTKKPPDRSDHLTMSLFAPGMSALHRAGLGGLACTLKALERQYDAGLLKANKLPAPYVDGQPPWNIDEQNVTLNFGKPEHAARYLERLFAFAFEIRKDGLINLPGHHDSELPAAVLADLQAGLILTFLQHGKVRQLAKEPTTVSYDPECHGTPGIIVEYRKCASFKHQGGWEAFVGADGWLVSDSIKVDGPISPGTVVRHVAFTSDTAAEDPPERMLPLYFALVGCLPLPVNRGVAALLVPEVENLREFLYDRPAMTPKTSTECQIANAADAALQAQIRLRGRERIAGSAIPSCYAMTFTPTAWASQQKSRVATIHVPAGEDRVLDRFARALAHLPTRVVPRSIKESVGRGKKKVVTERQEWFRADSIVRPLIAENLALGRPWYSGFTALMTKKNPATDKPYRDQLSFERKGLHDMISDQTMWDTAGEQIVVRAVHAALRGRYAQIADENKSNPVAMRNRFSGEYDRWRLAFAGAKTVNQFRTALCDLFSRAGRNPVLQQQWQEILPMLRSANWQHARDLALLALCSYQGRGDADAENTSSAN
jgi:CRISPR-associated protein Cas8a1/Csx13